MGCRTIANGPRVSSVWCSPGNTATLHAFPIAYQHTTVAANSATDRLAAPIRSSHAGSASAQPGSPYHACDWVMAKAGQKCQPPIVEIQRGQIRRSLASRGTVAPRRCSCQRTYASFKTTASQ